MLLESLRVRRDVDDDVCDSVDRGLRGLRGMRTQELKNWEGWGGRRHLKYFWSNSEWLVRRSASRSREEFKPRGANGREETIGRGKIQNKHHGNTAVLALHLSFFLSFSLILLSSPFTLLDSSLSPLPADAQKQCNHFDSLISAIHHSYFYYSDFSEKESPV